MKILLIFPQVDGRTGVYILKAFKKLGYEPIVIDPNVASLEYISLAVQEIKPDLTFCSRTFHLSNIADQLRTYSKKLVMWNVDVRDNVYKWQPLFPLMAVCDIVFTVGDPKQYWDIGFENACWLPQGIDPDTHKPCSIYEEDLNKYKCDILFVGGYGEIPWGPNRKNFLDKLLSQNKYSFKIFGGNSPQGLPFLNDTEANKAYQCSKINVGFSLESEDYTSVRDWKILATGARLLTNETKGKDKLLKGLDCYIFDNFDDFMDIADMCISDPINGDNVKIINENHTYYHRIKKAMEIIFNDSI